MDAMVSAALHEIAVEGPQGCSLPKLWAGLQGTAAAEEVDLDARVKQMIWKQVLHVPGISFLLPRSPHQSQTLEAYHPSIQSVTEAEKLGVQVLAPEGLRESCLGLYDGKLCDAAISRDQRELLERLAKARSQGVTQSQLGKEFKTGGNKMFYVVRSLEARGLVVRHATIVRTHQPTTKGASSKFVPIVATNLVHLTRYAKDQNLGTHARFEIPSSSKSNIANNAASAARDMVLGEENASQATEELLINDDHPAMERICKELESADDRVLVVSDLKLSLNYRFAQGHRSWRRLAKRLQDAGLVEIFNAQIAGSKIVPCIRLLKPFNAKAVTGGNDDTEVETQLRGVKRGQITDQVVESVLDRQIYDLVDNAGPRGLYMMDIWKQLGLNNKRNYFRVTNMLAKGCIVSEAEQHKKSMLYRLRTSSNAILAANCIPADESAHADQEPQNVAPLAQIAPPSTAKIRRTRKADKEKVKEKYMNKDIVVPNAANNLAPALQESNECRAMVVVDLSIVKVDEGEGNPGRYGGMYPCPLQTTTAIQRELRIMQRLQEERFIPRVELHRWIEDSEKDRKDTMMDRKTLTRLLRKLQREGRVKCIVLSMPGLTNCGRSRQSEVILLPEVEVEPELLSKVHDRIRQFDMMNRGFGSSKVKTDTSSVPVLMGVKQIHKGGKRILQPTVETEAEKIRTLSDNGFVPAKMIRVRMLHTFLWSYVNGISQYSDDELVMKPDNSSCRVFSLASAMKAIPLETFLQVVGSTKSAEELEPYSNKGLRLCDLPESETASLLNLHANSRLSWLIDVLRRLKLIRLVMGTGIPLGHSKAGFSRNSSYSLEASLIYAMEIQPYIEEPAPQPLSSLSLDAFDLTPRARHEFTLTSSESLEAYWQTLEYFFSGAMPAVARKAFPGSSVPELFGLRSWTSLRVMNLEQRRELMKRVEEGGEDRRLTHAECLVLARELNLSPEQVLRVSYEKNRRYRLQHLEKSSLNSSNGIPDSEVGKGHRIKPNIHAGSKRRAVTDADIVELAHVKAYKRQRQMEQGSSVDAQAATDTLQSPNKEGENNDVLEEDGEEEEEDREFEENPFDYLRVVSKLKPARRRRFPWSEDLDRILIRCYVRHRAIMGARNHRVEWTSIPSLPATPGACRRRIAQLKTDHAVRKALIGLCSLLAARYLKQPVDKLENQPQKIEAVCDISEANTPHNLNEDAEGTSCQQESDSMDVAKDLAWDSFEDISVAAALNEVMQLRNVARALNSKRSSVFRTNVARWPQQLSLTAASEHSGSNAVTSLSSMIEGSVYSHSAMVPFTTIAGAEEGALMEHVTRDRPRAFRVRKRKRSRKQSPLCEITSEEMVQRSLGIANAVELVKLVLLNAATAEVSSPLVHALRQCEESHVFAAFSFLQDQGYVIVGPDSKPFVLSPKFFHNAAASRFPFGTGIEALNTTEWLAEHDSEVDQDWVPIPMDNYCGQLIQLLEIVSEGTINMAPFLPKDGVGESEDNKNVVVGTKRKTEGGQEIQFMKPKIQRSDSSSPGFRRERGFPGIQVSIHRVAKPVRELLVAASQDPETANDQDQANEAMDLSPTEDLASLEVTHSHSAETAAADTGLTQSNMSSELVDCMHQFCSRPQEKLDRGGAIDYELNPELFKAAVHAIEEAGTEGLSISQLTSLLTCTDHEVNEAVAETYVTALESFDVVKQVNAYDHVRVIAAVHSAPFFIHVGTKKGEKSTLEGDASGKGDGESDEKGAQDLSSMATLTSLATAPSQPHLLTDSVRHRRVPVSIRKNNDSDVTHTVPMLPWLTADGGANSMMLKSLSRRVMGIVMLNPGILEEHLVDQLDVLNPQTARQLLQMLELDGHLKVRKSLQTPRPALPRIFGHLIKLEPEKTVKPIFRLHYYSTGTSGTLL